MELLCDRGVWQIFSDEFLYDSDSKRVPEKVFQHEPKPSGEKNFGTKKILENANFTVKVLTVQFVISR